MEQVLCIKGYILSIIEGANDLWKLFALWTLSIKLKERVAQRVRFYSTTEM